MQLLFSVHTNLCAPQYVLNMFLNSGLFQPQCSYRKWSPKKILIKRVYLFIMVFIWVSITSTHKVIKLWCARTVVKEQQTLDNIFCSACCMEIRLTNSSRHRKWVRFPVERFRGILLIYNETTCQWPREHEETERDTEGVGQDMPWTLKLFLVSESLFSETSAQITTSIWGF